MTYRIEISSVAEAEADKAFLWLSQAFVAIGYIMTSQRSSLYVPVSWLTIGLSLCAMAGMAIVGGWIAAISFAVTYAFLTFVVGSKVAAMDIMSAFFVSSILITVELVCSIAMGASSFGRYTGFRRR